MKIVLVVGSLRRNSFNEELAREVQKLLAGRAEATLLDYESLPLFNEDLEDQNLPILDRIKKTISESDGVWFFTPEYNQMIPGVLKNLLDWLSRANDPGNWKSGTCLTGRPAAISGAGGKSRTRPTLDQLEKLLNLLQMKVMESPQDGFAIPPEAFKTDNWTLSQADIDLLGREADAFLAFIGNCQAR